MGNCTETTNTLEYIYHLNKGASLMANKKKKKRSKNLKGGGTSKYALKVNEGRQMYGIQRNLRSTSHNTE